MSESVWHVYCLQTLEPPFQTYVGATVDLDRRLAQHNGILKGGARRTKTRPNGWRRVCSVAGFQDNHQALSFEWHWKHFSRRKAGGNREQGLEMCLSWFAKQHPGVPLTVNYE
jgi:predicted GIY-YIG superfamily endonuclease